MAILSLWRAAKSEWPPSGGRLVVPALAAFWFAALLGLGSFLFASKLYGPSVGALILSSLVAAGIGGAIGWTVARHIIRVRAEPEFSDRKVRPFSVRDELVGLSHGINASPSYPDIHLADLVSRLRASMERSGAGGGNEAGSSAEFSPEEVGSALKVALARLREVRQSA